jgi:hypothetical protein
VCVVKVSYLWETVLESRLRQESAPFAGWRRSVWATLFGNVRRSRKSAPDDAGHPAFHNEPDDSSRKLTSSS